MATNTKINLIAILILVLAVGGYFLLKEKVPAGNSGASAATSTPSTGSGQAPTSTQTFTDLGNGITVISSGGYTVTPVSGNEVPKAPDFKKAPVFSADISANVQSAILAAMAKDQALLTKNPNDYNAWLDLAIKYKMAGDYRAAGDIWIYTASLYPDDAVSRHNLGDLYQNYLKDFPKAESYYKSAIALSPANELDYLALHSLYRYQYKQDTSAAVDILKTAMARVPSPQVIDIYSALAQYYESTGEKADAIAYYTKARDGAAAVGNTDLAAQFDAAISALQ